MINLNNPSPKRNGLLGALPEEIYLTLLPYLEFVDLPVQHVISEYGDKITHIYFPTSGFISKCYITENGNSAETSMTGWDGLIGIALFTGGDTTPTRTVVAHAGNAYRLPAQIAINEFKKGTQFQQLVLRYIQALNTGISQTAVCNRHHTVDQQVCRWLLASLDRVNSNEICMTQQLIANALGVRREGVAEAACKLQKLGIIKYSRGYITVLQRTQLENRVCECYWVIQQELNRLLPYFHAKKIA